MCLMFLDTSQAAWASLRNNCRLAKPKYNRTIFSVSAIVLSLVGISLPSSQPTWMTRRADGVFGKPCVQSV
ncbi:hypothetical protein BH10CYA1_BH10CYA1_12280 [soil metagenome]